MKKNVFHAILCMKFAFSFQQACSLISLTPKNCFDVNKSNGRLVNSKTIFKLVLIDEQSDFIQQHMPLLLDWRTDILHIPSEKIQIFCLKSLLAMPIFFACLLFSS